MAQNSITITPIATGHAFTRNPIMLNMPGTGQRTYSIYGQGYTSASPAYKGEVTAPVAVNLAEFIEAIVPSIADPGNDAEMIMYGLQDGSVTVEVDDGFQQEPQTWQFAAHRGGVSKQNFRKLSQSNTDIFAARFFNSGCNFFLTTRTHDWRLNIKETELYPLVFFYPAQGTLAVHDIVGDNTVSLPAVVNSVDYHGELCSLNLEAVRQHLLEEYDVIANAFDVLVDNEAAARIAIQEARPQRERYRLKFRNSFGAFEVLELTGSAQWTPAIKGEQDEQEFKRYMADIDDFATERQRMELSMVMNVSTGHKTNDELSFILDAIASEDVYLLDVGSDPIKVIVTTDELAYDHRPNGPQALSLTLTPAEGDTCITKALTNELIPVRGDLFSEEYSEEFN